MTLAEGRKEQIGNICKDHLGNEYISVSQMCRAYGISLEVYTYRLRAGWNLKRTLTTPAGHAHDVECRDHKGTPFSSIYALCEEYDIPVSTFKMRIRNGWNLEKALTTPIRKYTTWVMTANAKKKAVSY